MLVNSGNLRVKADILSISPMSEPMKKGLTLHMSALKLFTVANLCYQLS